MVDPNPPNRKPGLKRTLQERKKTDRPRPENQRNNNKKKNKKEIGQHVVLPAVPRKMQQVLYFSGTLQSRAPLRIPSHSWHDGDPSSSSSFSRGTRHSGERLLHLCHLVHVEVGVRRLLADHARVEADVVHLRLGDLVVRPAPESGKKKTERQKPYMSDRSDRSMFERKQPPKKAKPRVLRVRQEQYLYDLTM